ncbi:MAG: ABC transporter substrate-binding protein, partial [bacterium]|nr:ABC transporter substrate-binding protein [bacterium]
FGPSDPEHPLGGQMWQAAQLALELENDAGGYRGKPFRLIPAWSKDPWGTGTAELARLVYRHHVRAIVGGIDGSSTHLAEQLVAKARLSLVSPVSTDRTANLANVPWIFSLAPGDHLEMGFHTSLENHGFRNNRANNQVVANGILLSNRNFLPFLGYATSQEVPSPKWRRRFDLPPLERMASIDDQAAAQRNYLEGDWIRFETILSTSSDQIALAPGELIKEWTAGERRYFQYRTSVPVINLICFLSARYEVRKEVWNGIPIEIYFHKTHDYNIDRMLETAKKSLDYCAQQFGPYPQRQLRIAEIPN